MKKILIVLLTFCLATFTFAQETDNTYWYREVDENGELTTYYMCKTEAQFNNAFKKIVKDQLGIEYDWHEPNWNTIKSSFISLEAIKKHFPKNYALTEDTDIYWGDYKYIWAIKYFYGGVYAIKVFKRVNGIEYRSITMMGPDHQWAYTQEVLSVLEKEL